MNRPGWILVLTAFVLVLCSAAQAQDALITEWRNRAYLHREEAQELRDTAVKSKQEVDKQRKVAKESRAKADEAEKKGDTASAVNFARQARDADNAANLAQSTAD